MRLSTKIASGLLLSTCLVSTALPAAFAFNVSEYSARVVKEHYDPQNREIGFRLGRYVIDGVLRDQPSQWIRKNKHNEIAVRNFSLQSIQDNGLVIDYDLRWQQFESIPFTDRRYKRAETNCDSAAVINLQVSQDSEIFLNTPFLEPPDCTSSGFGIEQVADYMAQGVSLIATGGEQNYGLFDTLAGAGTLAFNFMSAVNQTSTTLSDPIKAELFDNSYTSFINSVYELDDDYNEVYLSDIRYDPDGVWFIFTYPQWLQDVTDTISSSLDASLALTDGKTVGAADEAVVADILPGSPVAQGQWSSIRQGHSLVTMPDGRVLDWVPSDGSWRLWNYEASSTADVLPGSPVAKGQWSSIRQGHVLVPMADGRVLDWVPSDGSWRLWNYDASSTTDVLPGSPVAQGQWSSIRQGHVLVPMADGRVLDWVPADGSWRLWNYDASSTADVLPGSPVAQGQWSSIRQGHNLIAMPDGRVLDWVPSDGSWRLWNYDANSAVDVLPGSPVAQGQWSSIQQGHVLVPMADGRVLDWVPSDGSWRLWNYDS